MATHEMVSTEGSGTETPGAERVPPSQMDVRIARGILVGQRDGMIVFGVPGTDYQLHLVVDRPVGVSLGKKIAGVIRVQARRIDRIPTGGRYIEPVMGRPRRIQGTVLGIDEGEDALVVHAGVPVVCRTNDAQKAGDFRVKEMVSFDALSGGTFEVAG